MRQGDALTKSGKTIYWGHNTYLDEEYRRIIGMDLVLEIAAIKNGFGYGLTDINFKIQSLIKSNIFINGIRKYKKIYWWFVYNLLLRELKVTPRIPTNLPQIVSHKKESFQLCSTAEKIKTPNNGYWYKDICEIDFIRDNNFIIKRFLSNSVHKYFLYTNTDKNCYFVVRPIIKKNLLCLQVSDIRYQQTQPEEVQHIFKAIEILCKKIHAGAIFFTTSDNNIKKLFKDSKFCKSYPIAFVCGKKNVSSANANVIINAADSDDEYYQ